MTIDWLVRDEDPDLSVVIPTLPKREIQGRDTLKNQSCSSYEVLAVRDNSLDICEARNMGINIANSDLIALTDDDTRPPQDWVSTALNTLTGDVALLEGPILVVSDTGSESNFREKYRRYIGCNIAFRKDVWAAVGGFNTQFAGWGDDTVFGWEVERQFGIEQCRYDRGFRMYHIGELRSNPDQKLENQMRRNYPNRYFSLHRSPNSVRGKFFVAVLLACNKISPALADTFDQIM